MCGFLPVFAWYKNLFHFRKNQIYHRRRRMPVIIEAQHIAEFLTLLLIIILIELFDLLHKLLIRKGQRKRQIFQLEIVVFGALHFLVILGVEEAGLSDHGKIEGAAGVVADDDSQCGFNDCSRISPES